MLWNIQPLLGGEFGMVRDDIKFQGGNPDIKKMVPSLLFFLQDESGRTVVIDTSYGDLEDVRAMGLAAERKLSLPELFANTGLIPEKVNALLLTHTHWDHADNCGMFPNARIYCQKADWDYAFSSESGYSAKLQDTLRQAENRTILLDGDTGVLPGIRAVLLGGHTPGSQAFLVDSTDGSVLICSDDIMTFSNVEKNIPVGLCVNPDACSKALEFVNNSRPDYILPSHDYRSLNYTADRKSCCLPRTGNIR